VINTAGVPATTQSYPPHHDNVPPVPTITAAVSVLQHVDQGGHGRTDNVDTHSVDTQDRGGRDHYDYNRMPRYDERQGHGYGDYYLDRHGSYGGHYREREDPHYRSDRMRTAPSYQDQDHYAYDNRPRAHSRAPYDPYDPYDRTSESYPEYPQRYDYEDTYRRRYDYHGSYLPHEEEYSHIPPPGDIPLKQVIGSRGPMSRQASEVFQRQSGIHFPLEFVDYGATYYRNYFLGQGECVCKRERGRERERAVVDCLERVLCSMCVGGNCW